MATKQLNGLYAPDNSKYGALTDGNNTLVFVVGSTAGTKQSKGSQAPDGSVYFTLTDGSGNLVV